MNQELFLRRATKVHVPVGSGGATRAQVASAIQEIAAFHCILSESVIERIGMLSADELARWLRDMLACCAAGSARTCSTSRSIRASPSRC